MPQYLHPVCEGACRGKKWASDPLKLVLQCWWASTRVLDSGPLQEQAEHHLATSAPTRQFLCGSLNVFEECSSCAHSSLASLLWTGSIFRVWLPNKGAGIDNTSYNSVQPVSIRLHSLGCKCWWDFSPVMSCVSLYRYIILPCRRESPPMNPFTVPWLSLGNPGICKNSSLFLFSECCGRSLFI